MKKIKRISAVILCMAVLVMMTACGSDDRLDSPESVYAGNPTKLVLWYTDSKMQPYLEYVAAEYHQNNPSVTVENVLVSREQYLDKLYQSCAREDNGPDLYIASSDDLEEISLMGLAWENSNTKIYNPANYGEAAIAAATYAGKMYAYPLSYETAVMVYNSEFAQSVATFSELESFIGSFQHTDENASVEIIAQWDVTDIFLNYAFVGEYLTIAGKDGDSGGVSYLSEDFERSIQRYADMKEKLGIDKAESTYELCLEQFTSGKLLYTIVNTNDLKAISASGIPYGVCAIPDYDSIYKSKAISQTSLVVVNPYNDSKEPAQEYATALTYDYAKDMNSQGGLNAARSGIEGLDPETYGNAHAVYSDTIVKSQLMKTGDTYMQLEVLFHRAWDGENLADCINVFNNYMALQWGL